MVRVLAFEGLDKGFDFMLVPVFACFWVLGRSGFRALLALRILQGTRDWAVWV